MANTFSNRWLFLFGSTEQNSLHKYSLCTPQYICPIEKTPKKSEQFMFCIDIWLVSNGKWNNIYIDEWVAILVIDNVLSFLHTNDEQLLYQIRTSSLLLAEWHNLLFLVVTAFWTNFHFKTMRRTKFNNNFTISLNSIFVKNDLYFSSGRKHWEIFCTRKTLSHAEHIRTKQINNDRQPNTRPFIYFLGRLVSNFVFVLTNIQFRIALNGFFFCDFWFCGENGILMWKWKFWHLFAHNTPSALNFVYWFSSE